MKFESAFDSAILDRPTARSKSIFCCSRPALPGRLPLVRLRTTATERCGYSVTCIAAIGTGSCRMSNGRINLGVIGVHQKG